MILFPQIPWILKLYGGFNDKLPCQFIHMDTFTTQTYNIPLPQIPKDVSSKVPETDLITNSNSTPNFLGVLPLALKMVIQGIID